RPPPGSTPFPYTTLFRSGPGRAAPLIVDDSQRTALAGPPQDAEHEVGPVLAIQPRGADNQAVREDPAHLVLPGELAGAVHVERRSEEHTSELQSPCNLVC